MAGLGGGWCVEADAKEHRMVRPDGRSINQERVDQHGIHEVRGPLLVGGVEFLTPSTGLLRDLVVRRTLSSKQRFEAYLQFREQAFNVAASELVTAFDSPSDLFLFTREDGQQFQSDYLFHYIRFRDTSQHSIIVDDQRNGSGADNYSPATFLSADDLSSEINDYKNNKESFLQKVHLTQRYFAYRKGLLKLNISQFNGDTGKALEWLKASTRWSELPNDELRRGLKSHMDFLKEHESDSVALKRINAELASKLEKDLDTSDWALMGHYFNRMKLKSFARTCSIQARETGVILVKQALPLREICREEILSTSSRFVKLPLMKESVKQSFEGFLKETVKPTLKGYFGSLHRVQEKMGRASWWPYGVTSNSSRDCCSSWHASKR